MLESVRALVEDGWAVHLLRPRSKAPLNEGWSDAPVASFSALERAYRKGMNVGVRLGKPSRIGDFYLHAIDVDIRDPSLEDEALDALRELFGSAIKRMWRVKSGSAGPSFHCYFLTDTHFPSQNLAKSEGFIVKDGKRRRSWEIDFLGTGKQAALPPSIHPDTGRRYSWAIEPNDFPVEIDSDTLADILEPEAYEPADNADPVGMDLDEASAILDTLKDHADDHATWVQVGMALKHEFGEDAWPLFDEWSRKGRGYNRRDNRYQWDRFKNDRRKLVTMRTLTAEAREVELAEAIEDFGDSEPEPRADKPAPKPKVAKKNDPDLTILQQTDIAAPPLPIDVFGKRLARQIELMAKDASAPPDYVAAAVLGGASASIGNAVWVEIKPNYRQPPILWLQIIGPPSSNKSPALRPVTGALGALEDRYFPIYAEAHKQWESEKAAADIKRRAWEGMVKGMVAEGRDGDFQPPEGVEVPPEPHRRQFIINDVTIEAYIRAQERNPRGFMMFRDELTGWLASMERYSSDSDRAIWLEAYEGGRYAVERVKDAGKAIRVTRLCSPVLGGIQPERLLEITSRSTADDGLQARFMPFWPEYQFRPMTDAGSDNSMVLEMFQTLSELTMKKGPDGGQDPHIVPFTKAAFKAFQAWSDRRKEDETWEHTRLGNVFGKADGHVARLALVLEYIWWAVEADFDDLDPPDSVSVEAVRAAIRFRETYLKPMQKRVFSSAIEPLEVTNARSIAQWIVSEDIEVLNARDVRRKAGIKGINGNTQADLVEQAIAVLVSMRWLIPEERSSSGKGGRPRKDFLVNPRLHDLL